MGRSRKYAVDEKAFNIIDSEEKAYWLGFLYADGYVLNNQIYLELSVVDICHIKAFLKFLNSNYVIRMTKNNCASVTITSKQMVEDLNKIGCTEKKSKTLVYPKIESNLQNHFIRGYFDGDGSLYKCATQNRYEMSILGTKEFLIPIPSILGIPSNKILKSNKRADNYKLKYGGRKKVKEIMDKIYCNATIFLNRKKEKYDELCETLI